MSKYKKCIHYKVCYELTWHEPNGDIAGHQVCKLFDERKIKEKPKTQFDLIKNMNVEEMSNFLMDWAMKLFTGDAPMNVKTWLESEVESNE